MENFSSQQFANINADLDATAFEQVSFTLTHLNPLAL